MQILNLKTLIAITFRSIMLYKKNVYVSLKKPQSQQQQQQTISNIPTHKQSNNFQQHTLPRYNPPPPPNPINSNNNHNIPIRRLQRGRTSLLPPSGSLIHHQTPLASPALSTTSTAISAPDNSHKSHIPFVSRIPTDMLKFQVRKSEGEQANGNSQQQQPLPHQTSSQASHTSTNAQIQVIASVCVHARIIIIILQQKKSVCG